MKATALFLPLLWAATLCAQSANASPGKLYAVIFEITVDSSGKMASLKISKVTDPATGTTTPVSITVPEGYLSAAKAFFLKRTYTNKPSKFYSYTFYDPAQPNRADIDPTDNREH
ncbi:MAG: hypothetical protein WAW36_02225 [Methylovulum miyakonense]|uniref:hypothetical protein n=1 Tax=Methylovulum miyakonense TaxID=645578 RepID=UPI003BB66EFB